MFLCDCVLCLYLYSALFDLVAAGGIESRGLLEDKLACCLEGLWTRERSKKNTAVSTTHIHFCTLLAFPQNDMEIHLALQGTSCQTERMVPFLTGTLGPEKGFLL